MENTLEAATIGQVYRRLVPLLCCSSSVYLDRVNIGFAALRINQGPRLQRGRVRSRRRDLLRRLRRYSEVPSNIVLHRFGARIWIARIMVTWGLVSAGLAFVLGGVVLRACAFCSAWRRPASSRRGRVSRLLVPRALPLARERGRHHGDGHRIGDRLARAPAS